MRRLRIALAQLGGTFPDYMERHHGHVQRAASSTMEEVRDTLITQGRGDIASAGFPVGMQRALRAVKHPRKTPSINSAVWLWHRSNYAGVFEDGGEISGNPLLWLPLETTMPKLGRRKISPSLLASRGVELVSWKSPRGIPLIGAPMRVKGRRARDAKVKPTLAALRRGREGVGTLRTIPLFHGVRKVNLKKRIDIKGIAARTQGQIPAIFLRHFQNEEPR